MPDYKLPKVPVNVEVPFKTICNLITNLCEAKLSKEYNEISIILTAKIARKRPSPLLAGNPNTWAAGIIHALGLVNFLFDKSQTPHMTSFELSQWFDLGQSTVSAKSKNIRGMFKMSQLDPKWCLPSKLAEHPTAWLVSIDGYIIDIRHATSYDMQAAAYQAGVIPYIPGAQKIS